MSAKLCVPSGSPDQVRGGETFLPSQVYNRGIELPSARPSRGQMQCRFLGLRGSESGKQNHGKERENEK